jgi:2'-5' RNA ligase
MNSHDYPEVYKELGIDLSKLGCIMADIKPLDNMYSIEWDGAGIALYYAKNKERFWIDGWVLNEKAHVTLLYGLLESGETYKKHIDEVLKDWSMDTIRIDHVGYFDSPYEDEEYWCIVAHVKKTPELLEAHERLSFLPHINTFPEYNAHMTICYLDKRQGEKYRDQMIESFNNNWAGKRLEVLGLNYGGNK